MAIDSAEDRRSAAVVGLVHHAPGITVNVSHDVEWRQQSGWGYSGILPAGGAVAPDEQIQHFVYRPFNRLRAQKFF